MRGHKGVCSLRRARRLTRSFAAALILLTALPAFSLKEEEIPHNSWIVEKAERLHSLAPLREVDPWSRPFTRGALARDVLRIRSLPVAEEDRVLDGLLTELEEELAGEIGPVSREPRFTSRGTLHFDAEDRKRGALRITGSGDLAVRLNDLFSWQQRMEIASRTDGDVDWIGKEWESGITGCFTHAFAALDFGRVKMTAGRREISWGPGLSGTLILQGESPPLDQVGVSVKLGRFDGYAFAARIDDIRIVDEEKTARRYLSGHRVTFHLGERARFGLSETIVYGGPERPFDWAYANPLMLYYGVQWNRRNDDNVFWSADGYFRLTEQVDLFGEFLIDDFQYDFETEPDQIAFLVGTRLKKLPGIRGLFIDAEYVRLHNWVYGHSNPWNRYTHGEAILGHPIGPDADRVLTRLYWMASRTWDVSFRYAYLREGEGSIDDPRDSAVPFGATFLSGNVTRTTIPTLRIGYQPRAGRRFHVGVERNGGNEWIVFGGVELHYSLTSEI